MPTKNKLSRLGGWMLLACGAALASCGGSDGGSSSRGTAAPPANELSLAATAGEALFRMFATLHKAVQWYVTRDINNNTGNNPMPVAAGLGGNPYFPLGTFYTTADGTPDLYQYNDLPTAFDANVNVGEVPYTAPKFSGGQSPTLTAAEIDDLVAFLCTLTDGYDPKNPSAYNVPGQCLPTAVPGAAPTEGSAQ